MNGRPDSIGADIQAARETMQARLVVGTAINELLPTAQTPPTTSSQELLGIGSQGAAHTYLLYQLLSGGFVRWNNAPVSNRHWVLC